MFLHVRTCMHTGTQTVANSHDSPSGRRSYEAYLSWTVQTTEADKKADPRTSKDLSQLRPFKRVV